MISTLGLWLFVGCWIAVCVFAFLHRQVVLGVILTSTLILFAVGEVVALLTTGRTITQRFKRFRDAHPVQAWTILGLIGVGIAALVLHLGC